MATGQSGHPRSPHYRDGHDACPRAFQSLRLLLPALAEPATIAIFRLHGILFLIRLRPAGLGDRYGRSDGRSATACAAGRRTARLWPDSSFRQQSGNPHCRIELQKEDTNSRTFKLGHFCPEGCVFAISNTLLLLSYCSGPMNFERSEQSSPETHFQNTNDFNGPDQ